MYKYRVAALTILLTLVMSLPMLSYSATPSEQTLKSETEVGSFTNLTFVSNTIVSDSGNVISNQNSSGYINTRIVSVNAGAFNLTQHVWDSNGTLTDTYNYTVKFNSTDTALFDFLNS